MTPRRAAYGVNALSAWIGLGLSIVFETFGLVPQVKYDPPTPTSQFNWYGHYAHGLSGAGARLADLLSYFTIWSQIVVGVIMTLLYLNPQRKSKWFKVIRLDAVMMIMVTGIVYNILLGPKYPPVGVNKYSSMFEHQLTPLITVIVFLVWGPRGWFTVMNLLRALILPVIWVVYTFLRGAILDSYPYDFFDVVSYGYASVITFVLGILFASLIVMCLLWALDAAIDKNRTVRQGPVIGD
jgi:hypothetical protein